MGPEPSWQTRSPELRGEAPREAEADPPGPRTTLRIREGSVLHRDAHLRRLQEALDHLGIPRDWLDEAFAAAVGAASDGILRIRVVGAERHLLTRLEPWSPLPSPYRLQPAPHPLGEARGDPAARHKGLRGDWSAEALALARSRGAEDLLCLWPDGTLAETVIASVAVEDGLSLRVPPREGRVASIAEAEDLPRWAEARGRVLVRGPVPFREIAGKGLVCFNAARGVWQAEVLPSAEP